MPSGVDSVHVAALDDLRSLKLDGGRLLLELTSGEKYALPVAELMSGGQDKTLEVRETLPGRPAPFRSQRTHRTASRPRASELAAPCSAAIGPSAARPAA